MKKIYSIIPALFLMVSFCLFVAACSKNKDDEKLQYFRTELFTEESFYSAIRKYGKANDYHNYYLTDNQAKAAYENDTVKMLMTSEKYNSAPEDISLLSLWDAMYEDIFSNNYSYTVKSLVETICSKCIRKGDYVVNSFILHTEEYMTKNDSIVNLCKNNGYEIYEAFENENLKLYDLAELFIETDTWKNNNTNIACFSSLDRGFYPFAFNASYWYNYNYEYLYEGNSGFENSTVYKRLIYCVKFMLKDPDSYRSNGSINFYSTLDAPIIDGYYMGEVYVRVPFRAKNGFGGYGTNVAWLTYDWNNRTFSWYGLYMPSNINKYPFYSEYVD